MNYYLPAHELQLPEPQLSLQLLEQIIRGALPCLQNVQNVQIVKCTCLDYRMNIDV